MTERKVTIRLRPSSTTYADFMRKTADALGLPYVAGQKRRPNPRVLALMRLEGPQLSPCPQERGKLT